MSEENKLYYLIHDIIHEMAHIGNVWAHGANRDTFKIFSRYCNDNSRMNEGEEILYLADQILRE